MKYSMTKIFQAIYLTLSKTLSTKLSLNIFKKPFKLKLFLKNQPNSIFSISKQELIAISQLIAKGYSIKDALLLIDEKFESIVLELEKGKPFIEFIPLHKKQLFYQSLSFFLSITTLSEACLEAKEMEDMRNRLLERIIKSLAYPLFVFIFSLVVFIVFEWLIYPQLSSLMESGEQQAFISFFFVSIRILIICLVMMLISLIVIMIAITKNESFKLTLIEKVLLKISLVKQYLSYDFAVKVHILMKSGYSTKQTFYALKALKREQYLFFISTRMIAELENGQDYVQVVQNEKAFDQKFKYFFKLGSLIL